MNENEARREAEAARLRWLAATEAGRSHWDVNGLWESYRKLAEMARVGPTGAAIATEPPPITESELRAMHGDR